MGVGNIKLVGIVCQIITTFSWAVKSFFRIIYSSAFIYLLIYWYLNVFCKFYLLWITNLFIPILFFYLIFLYLHVCVCVCICVCLCVWVCGLVFVYMSLCIFLLVFACRYVLPVASILPAFVLSFFCSHLGQGKGNPPLYLPRNPWKRDESLLGILSLES